MIRIDYSSYSNVHSIELHFVGGFFNDQHSLDFNKYGTSTRQVYQVISQKLSAHFVQKSAKRNTTIV